MRVDYNYEYNNQTVIYTLCLLVFVSTFFIAIKMLSISIMFSLLVYLVLVIVSGLYLINAEHYSIYKYDMIIYSIVFWGNSIYYLIKLTLCVWSSKLEHNSIAVFFIILFLSLINQIILINKISCSKIYKRLKNVIILFCYTYAIVMSILIFSNIYIIKTNISIKEYISSNFTFDQVNKKYTEIDKSILPDNYFSYNSTTRSFNIYYEFNQEQLNTYIYMRFRPVSKLEDYIFYSTLNILNGCSHNINVNGNHIKLIVILQHYIFILFTFITITHIIDTNNNFVLKKYKGHI